MYNFEKWEWSGLARKLNSSDVIALEALTITDDAEEIQESSNIWVGPTSKRDWDGSP